MNSLDAKDAVSARPLAGMTVLDLTDHRGELGPWLLAELGADVIKIEPPGGTPARAALPLRSADAAADDLRSWQFCAYNSNKRSIVLDLDGADDRGVFEGLVQLGDFIYESGVPGPLAAAGYGHEDLAALNARIVHVQVTPFGLDGPRSADPASELSLAALGGPANMQGVFERAPVKMSIAQAWRHAGAEAAAAGLMAHARMRATGSAQHVGVSAQAAMDLDAAERHGDPRHLRARLQALGHGRAAGCAARDALPHEGRVGDSASPEAWRTGRMLDWYIEEGPRRRELARRGLGTPTTCVPRPASRISRTFDELYRAMVGLCERHTNAELLERSVVLKETIAPVHTVADLVRFEHLRVAGFLA